MTGEQFAVAMGKRAGLFALGAIAVSALPLLAAGACGICGLPVMVAAEWTGRPLVLIAFLISLVDPAKQRMQAMGVWPIAGLALPLLLLADWQALSRFTNPTLLLASQFRGLQVPVFAMAGVAFGLWLALGRDDAKSPLPVRRPGLWWLAVACIAASLVVGFVTTLVHAMYMSLLFSGGAPKSSLLWDVGSLAASAAPFVGYLTVAILLLLTVVDRMSSDDAGGREPPRALPDPPAPADRHRRGHPARGGARSAAGRPCRPVDGAVAAGNFLASRSILTTFWRPSPQARGR